MGNIGGREWFATARETTLKSQTQMMGSASFLGWIGVVVFLVLAGLGRSLGFAVAAGVLGLVTICWQVVNHRRRHRWDHLMAKAAQE